MAGVHKDKWQYRRTGSATIRGKCLKCHTNWQKKSTRKNTKGEICWAVLCDSCERDRYKHTSKRTRKRNFSRHKLGLTSSAYLRMLRKQKFRCSTCSEHIDTLGKNLSVDHCHTTGKVRGLLCSHCNWALGHVKDNVKILARLIEYLEASK